MPNKTARPAPEALRRFPGPPVKPDPIFFRKRPFIDFTFPPAFAFPMPDDTPLKVTRGTFWVLTILCVLFALSALIFVIFPSAS